MKFLKSIKQLMITRLCGTIVHEENKFFKEIYKEYLERLIEEV